MNWYIWNINNPFLLKRQSTPFINSIIFGIWQIAFAAQIRSVFLWIFFIFTELSSYKVLRINFLELPKYLFFHKINTKSIFSTYLIPNPTFGAIGLLIATLVAEFFYILNIYTELSKLGYFFTKWWDNSLGLFFQQTSRKLIYLTYLGPNPNFNAIFMLISLLVLDLFITHII